MTSVKKQISTSLGIGVEDATLLEHFTNQYGSWAGSLPFQAVIQKHALQLCEEAPYIKHAILAFAASHLAFLYPDQLEFAKTSTRHYQRSLALYSAEISTKLDAKNVNAIIGCAHLQTMLAFANMRFEDSTGFSWLTAMRGVPILWNTAHLKGSIETSIWKGVCADPGIETGIPGKLIESDIWGALGTRLCLALHQICNVSGLCWHCMPKPDLSNSIHDLQVSQSTEEPNPYANPLSRLCRLLRYKVDHSTMGVSIFFIGKLEDAFLQRVNDGDSRAILIICYWCALFSQVDQWWITRSALAECRRLCRYLESTSDQAIIDLLPFPSTKCGYAHSNSGSRNTIPDINNQYSSDFTKRGSSAEDCSS